MKIRLPVHAATHQGYVVLKEADKAGKELIDRLFSKKKEWEERNGKEFFLQVELDLPYQKRTFKQNSSAWVLVTAIFQSMEGRLPDEEEKYCLYLDLLELYADKVPSRFGGLRPVRISEANSFEGARFIDGLIYHLAKWCELTYDAQSTVVGVLQEWEDWRGTLEIDPADYSDLACKRLLTVSEWREKRPVSQASGRGGQIILHHIVTRGSCKAVEGMAWNWLALLDDEHRMLHEKGYEYFLTLYPHLRGRVNRARNLAGKLELDFKNSQRTVVHTAKSLAMQALEE